MLIQITSQGTTDKIRSLFPSISFRGIIPAPLLIISTQSDPEDTTTGMPLSGQNGKLLELLLDCACDDANMSVPNYAIVNETSDWTTHDFIALCKPRLLIILGGSIILGDSTAYGHSNAVRLAHPETLLHTTPFSLRWSLTNQWIGCLAKSLSTIKDAQAPSDTKPVYAGMLSQDCIPVRYESVRQTAGVHPMHKHPETMLVERTTGRRHNVLTPV